MLVEKVIAEHDRQECLEVLGQFTVCTTRRKRVYHQYPLRKLHLLRRIQRATVTFGREAYRIRESIRRSSRAVVFDYTT